MSAVITGQKDSKRAISWVAVTKWAFWAQLGYAMTIHQIHLIN